MTLAPARRLLILKPCCAGDVVMATAALAALRRAFPAAHIAWAVHAWARPIVAHNPHLNALLDTPAAQAGGAAGVRALARRVRAGRFDTCVTLDRSPLLALAPWLAGVPVRVGLDSAGRGFAHTLRVRVSPQIVRHEAELYLDCARALGADTQGVYAEFQPAPADVAWAAEQLAAWAGPGALALLNPAGGTNPGMALTAKRWPAARYAALAQRLRADGARVALVAGPGDAQVLASVQAQLPEPLPALELPWGRAGALAARAALYVGNDTGLTHVAAAAGCRTVAIFGPSDPRRYAPYAPPERLRVAWRPAAVPAAGVSAGAPAGWSWDQGVDVDEVWQAVLELLSDPKDEV
jgi:ADP-heptose:LPS heptosyltransferase